MTSIVLNYDHSPGLEVQSTYFWCGPTSTGIVLSTFGIEPGQQQLANELGTTVNGTDNISQVTTVLNNHLPGADYVTINGPSTDALWTAIVASIEGGRGCVFNIVAPPWNYPVGVLGSQTPAYAGGTVFHYIAGMGFNDDARAVLIADPGFKPFTYWISLDQLASLVATKGITASTNNSLEAFMATNQEKLDFLYDKFSAYVDSGDIAGVTQGGKWTSRARYAPDPTVGVDDLTGMLLYTDANGFDLMVEFAASQGYEPAKQLIAARAKAHPEDGQAVFYAKKYPA
jgi:hypothetical protein